MQRPGVLRHAARLEERVAADPAELGVVLGEGDQDQREPGRAGEAGQHLPVDDLEEPLRVLVHLVLLAPLPVEHGRLRALYAIRRCGSVNSSPSAAVIVVGMSPTSTSSRASRLPSNSLALCRSRQSTWYRSADCTTRSSGLRWKLSATTTSSLTGRWSRNTSNMPADARTASPSRWCVQKW